MSKTDKHIMVGWREVASLPEFGLLDFRAKIDTGARTTALHARDISTHEFQGRRWVEFSPDHGALDAPTPIAAPLIHERDITNTSGLPERRYVIAGILEIAGRKARIEISLTDRRDMKFPIIIGRTALRRLRLTVNPARSWSTKPQKSSKLERK